MSDPKPRPKPEPASPRSVFVISPIGSAKTADHARYRKALDYVIKKAFPEPEWSVMRADDEVTPDSITTQVIGRIYESNLIVADLTDHNPNVFYELAVAHGYRKRVIHIMQEGQKPPFDLGDQRMIFYDLEDVESVYDAQEKLRQAVAALDENPSREMRNPLTAYEQFEKIATASGDDQGGEAIAQALERLSRQVDRIEGRLPQERDSVVWGAKVADFDRATSKWLGGSPSSRAQWLEQAFTSPEPTKAQRVAFMREVNALTERLAELKDRQQAGEEGLETEIEDLSVRRARMLNEGLGLST